jgi:hypothetical protein
MNLNVWARTLISVIVCSIFGIWQDTHSAGAVGLMMRVSFDGRGMRTVRGRRAMATQAELVHGLDQVSVIAGPMNVMTIEACYAAAVHDALNEVISLHAVLMSGFVSDMHEVSPNLSLANS